MATSSPSPNVSPSASSPLSAPSTNAPSPQSPPPTNATSLQSPPPTNATSPQSPPPTNATSPQSPPLENATSPLSPPITKVMPPQSSLNANATSPQSPPPEVSPPPPPTHVISPPPVALAPSPPPPVADPPNTSSPPPSPPSNSSSPPPSPPPKSSPPTSSPPPENSPPPSDAEPPESPPSPPVVTSPPPSKKSPPPPLPGPAKSPSTPPPRTPPPPQKSPSPPPPISQNVPPSPPPQSPPSPPVTTSSPPPPVTTSSLPPPSHVQIPPPPPSNHTTDSTSGNAPEVSSSSGNGGLGTGGVAAIGAALGLLLLCVVGIAFCFVRRKKNRHSRSNGGYIMPTSRVGSPHSDSGLLKAGASASRYESTSGSELINSPSKRGILGSSRVWFTYEELFEATNGFSKPNLLGEGGFGSVYKGYLPDGKEVAVKQLKIGGGQGEREFKAEVEIISRIHHRHLVSLAGYCIWESKRLLVYEYVPNNNLHFHLHGESKPVMDWATRVKISAGAARGIAYLHEDCHPRIIHRDIKSSNILLDNNFEAQVADFGLAKLAEDANTHISTRVVGTFGYMAPEYASSGKLTEKSDVYSFGVVLLELITGRKPVDEDESLVEWARPLLNKALETAEFESLADPKLDKNYVDSEMLQMVEVAAACVRHSAVKRPRMGQVVRAFESMIASDITNGMPVGESEIYNTPAQSSEMRWLQRMAFGNQDFSTDFFSPNSSMNKLRSFGNEP